MSDRASKVLFVPYSAGSMAHLVRCAVVARTLQSCGHEIHFATDRSGAAFLRNFGFSTYGNGCRGAPSGNYHRDLRTYELEAARHFSPDVVVNDPVFAGNFICAAQGIPLVLMTNSVLLPSYPGYYGYSRPGGVLGSEYRFFGDYYPRKVLFPRLRDTARFLKIDCFPDRYEDLFEVPLIIIPSIEALDPIDYRSNIIFCAPMLLNELEQVSEDVTRFIEESKRSKIAYLCLGGSVNESALFRKLAQALLACGYRVLIAFGPRFRSFEFRSMMKDSRIFCRRYLPGTYCARHADIVVSAGSHGSIMQALVTQSPLLCAPHNVDQATYSFRTSELRIGMSIYQSTEPHQDFERWKVFHNKLTATEIEPFIRQFEKFTGEYKQNLLHLSSSLSCKAQTIETLPPVIESIGKRALEAHASRDKGDVHERR